MKRPQLILVALLGALSFASSSDAALITYFNFHDDNLVSDGGVQLSTITENFSSGGVAFSTSGSNLNLISGDTPGDALQLINNANNGRYIQFSLSTLGVTGLSLSYATYCFDRPTKGGELVGFTHQTLSYSTDGTTFTTVSSFDPPPAVGISYSVANFDLSSISAIENQASVTFRLTFTGANCMGCYDLVDNMQVNGTPPALSFNSAASRAIHGTNGPALDIDLPLSGTPGIECRNGDGSGDGNHTIVFTFSNPISTVDNATPNCGSLVSSGVDPGNSNNYIVQFNGATCNQQYVTITLTGVHDTYNQTLDSVSATVGLLVGDTNKDGRVNVGDTNQTKALSGADISLGENYRNDVNLDGRINIGDTNFVKAHSGSFLP